MVNTESVDTIIETFYQRLAENKLDKLVKVELTAKPGVIFLDRICSEYRRQGHADIALKILLSLCDENLVAIELIPHPLDEDQCLEDVKSTPRLHQDIMGKEQLEEWYGGYGFKCKAVGMAEEVSVMRREPRQQQ